MTTTHVRLIKALIALGRSADQVADTLRAGGWKGLREDGIACPISRYVVAVVPDIEVAATSFNRITVVSTTGESVEATLPGPASRFVTAFDTGDYDDLAATATTAHGDPIDDLER